MIPEPPIPYSAMTDEELLREVRLCTHPLITALAPVLEEALNAQEEHDEEVAGYERNYESLEELNGVLEQLAEDRLADIALLTEQRDEWKERFEDLEKKYLEVCENLQPPVEA